MTAQTPVNMTEWLAHLQASGYRVTAPRKAIVEVVAHSDFALNPSQIFDQARVNYPAIGLVTVYRTLDKLTELGLIDRVHLPTGCDAYLPAPDGHQHLLICESCGKAEYFSGDNLGSLIQQVEQQSGYTVRSHWLQFFGCCAKCAATNP